MLVQVSFVFFLLHLRQQEYWVTALQRHIHRPYLSVKSTPHLGITDKKAFDSSLLLRSDKRLGSTALFFLMRCVVVCFVCFRSCDSANCYMVVNISVIDSWDSLNLPTLFYMIMHNRKKHRNIRNSRVSADRRPCLVIYAYTPTKLVQFLSVIINNHLLIRLWWCSRVTGDVLDRCCAIRKGLTFGCFWRKQRQEHLM